MARATALQGSVLPSRLPVLGRSGAQRAQPQGAVLSSSQARWGWLWTGTVPGCRSRVPVSVLSPGQQAGWRAPSPACPITPAQDRVGSLQHRAPLRSLRPSQPESGGQWKAPGFWTRPGTTWTLGREATGSFPLKHSRAPVRKDSPGHPATSELQGPPQ